MKTILKRLLAIAMAAAMLASVSFSASALEIEGAQPAISESEIITYAETNGVLNYEVTEENEITITGLVDELATELVIPSEIDGLPVTSIGRAAFSNSRSLTTVTIPASVKRIGENAFFHSTKLTTVTISEGG